MTRPVTVSAESSAPADRTWRLLATPSQWPRWAPHISAVEDLDGGDADREVRRGQHLRITSVGPVRVQATVTRVDPGLRWDFRVLIAGVALDNTHEVQPTPEGVRVVVTMRTEVPRLPPAVAVSDRALRAYRPLAALAVGRLARLAEQDGWSSVALGRRLAAIAQDGLHYTRDPYDRDRYTALRGIATDLLAGSAQVSREAMEPVLAAEAGHATTKVDVRGFLVDQGGRVLLVRERSDGRWALPGGWAEPHSGPAQAVRAEVAEEAGLDVEVTRLLACFDRDRQEGARPLPHRVFKLIFACAVLGPADRGTGMAGQETTDVGWFAVDDLPPLSLGRTTSDQLRRLRALIEDPVAPALFD